jgi:calcineurin-like phosphoesterase family protein
MGVFFTADPHLGHKSIAKFRTFVKDTQHNTELFVQDWIRNIRKNDVIYMLGDVAFDAESLKIVAALPGRKILVKGNHDDYINTSAQAKVFEEIHGMISYKSAWLTHCPIHPDELRARKVNVHGHVHNKSVMRKKNVFWQEEDPRYVNACVDVVYPKYGTMFLSLDQIKERF